ncbi:copper homeostasis protein CutC [Vibrio hannami]|uniref:copper homeostasis protein CutC n=1 Tax=Vibrio hannami TaxID=2717094 RepID=UPI00240FE3AE|nr:copper homeostasis protein CutC [Vibrio hannami]MDG3087213.1 copper homeostasis protein CutC [Vibrio hannami]
MSIEVEVCIDNLESLHNAIKGGATRIELCSSLALGGLTPSYGIMKQAARISSIPVYAMIRPRQGDFLYDSDDIESMLEDIYIAKKAGVDGVVFGVLTSEGVIDEDTCIRLMSAASGVGTTFHRAIDHCSDYEQAIDAIKSLGCERVLTSGLKTTAYEGRDTIRSMRKLAGNKLSIMAGAGVSADNVAEIVSATGVNEVHLSGKSQRVSYMKNVASAHMGNADISDHIIPVTSSEKIAQVLNSLKSLN